MQVNLTHDFRNIRKPQVAFLSAVLLFMSIFLSWIKQQDLSVIILFKKALHSEPQHDLWLEYAGEVGESHSQNVKFMGGRARENELGSFLKS